MVEESAVGDRKNNLHEKVPWGNASIVKEKPLCLRPVILEAEQVVDSLESRGVPVEYVLFADEGHGFRKTANRITATVSIVEWFKSYLTAEE